MSYSDCCALNRFLYYQVIREKGLGHTLCLRSLQPPIFQMILMLKNLNTG